MMVQPQPQPQSVKTETNTQQGIGPQKSSSNLGDIVNITKEINKFYMEKPVISLAKRIFHALKTGYWILRSDVVNKLDNQVRKLEDACNKAKNEGVGKITKEGVGGLIEQSLEEVQTSLNELKRFKSGASNYTLSHIKDLEERIGDLREDLRKDLSETPKTVESDVTKETDGTDFAKLEETQTKFEESRKTQTQTQENDLKDVEETQTSAPQESDQTNSAKAKISDELNKLIQLLEGSFKEEADVNALNKFKDIDYSKLTAKDLKAKIKELRPHINSLIRGGGLKGNQVVSLLDAIKNITARLKQA